MSHDSPSKRTGLVERLRASGSVFPEDEAEALGYDEALIERRVAGERVEHILGRTRFCGLEIEVDPGVFIPRPHSEELADAAAELEPSVALDLFTGTGAIACVIKARNPGARVVAGELDPAALACAHRNGERYGVEVYESDVDAGVPRDLEGRVDVLTAIVPYVPTAELPFVPRDGEPAHAFDGGPDGLAWVRRVKAASQRWLGPGGVLLMEAPDHGVGRIVRS